MTDGGEDFNLGHVVGADGEAGNGIASITKTGTSGLVDTYTITYDDGNSTTFTVTNGSDASVTIQTSWGSTTSDSKVASEKLTKDTIDGKLDNALSSTAVTVASDDNILITDYSDSNKIKRVENILASQVKDGNIHSNISTLANSSQAVINNAIDMAIGNKVSKSSTTGLLKNDGTVDTTSYSTFSGSYNDLSGKPTIPTKTSDLTNDGDGTNVFVKNNDSRLTDSRTPTSHTHGNLTNDGKVGSNANYIVVTGTGGAITSVQKLGNITYDGKIGSTSGKPLITTTSGTVTTGSFGTSSGTFAEGNHTHSGYVSATKVTSWSSTVSDSNVPSEKLVKDYIDNQIGLAIQYIQQ